MNVPASYDFVDPEIRTQIDVACKVVWPIERRYVCWYFAKGFATKSEKFLQAMRFDGLQATAYWAASAFWAGVGMSSQFGPIVRITFGPTARLNANF